MRLRRGLFIKDLAFRFSLNYGLASKIFRCWIVVIASRLKFLINWPDRITMRKVSPRYFYNFRSCISLIDCFEIFIQRSLGLNSRAQSWSSYKNSNTVKYLISITPTGSVSFCSEGWGGCVSDKQITIQSGFLNMLETGDLILADRGFRIEQEVATKGAILKVAAFTKGRSQLSAKEVDKSRQLANVINSLRASYWTFEKI